MGYISAVISLTRIEYVSLNLYPDKTTLENHSKPTRIKLNQT